MPSVGVIWQTLILFLKFNRDAVMAAFSTVVMSAEE
jgi:hypothetical protein